MKKVLLSEDASDEVIKSYIDRGFRPHFLSKRKIKRKDRLTYNKVRRHNLDPALDLKFGEVKDLNDKYNYDEINISGDPIWDKLSVLGDDPSKYKILNTIELSDGVGAIEAQSLVNDVHMKFVKVKVLYTYELKSELSGESKLIDGSRDFCRKMVGLNKMWSLEELQSVSTTHLTDMGLPPDVFIYRGGFWNQGGGVISASCRHTFKANVVVEK